MVLLYDIKLKPTGIDVDGAKGFCIACQHRKEGNSPPELDLRDQDSILDYINWYESQVCASLSHTDMCKARLCCLTLSENDRAMRYLADWLLCKLDSESLQAGSDVSDFLLDPPAEVHELVKTLRAKKDKGGQWLLDNECRKTVLVLEHVILLYDKTASLMWLANALQIDQFDRDTAHDYDLDQYIEILPEKLNYDTWDHGWPVDEFLYALVYANVWQIGGVDCSTKALDAMSRMTSAFLKSAHRIEYDPFMKMVLHREYGIQIEDSYASFLCRNIIEVFVSLLEEDDIRGDTKLPDSVFKLNLELQSHPAQTKCQELLGELIDVFQMSEEFEESKGTKDTLSKLASKRKIESHLIQKYKGDESEVHLFLTILEARKDSLKFHDKSVLQILTGEEPSASTRYKPVELWCFHPAIKDIGKETAMKALRDGVTQDLRRRIYDAFPEITIPHLTSSLESLKGLGHDHTIDLTTRLVREIRSNHSVQMLGVGDKIALLEREMRDKLIGLYGKEREKDLAKLFSSFSEDDSEAPINRMQDFQRGMQQRRIAHGDISILDFITFGELRVQLWAHTYKGKLKHEKPMFKQVKINETDLVYHARLITVFRNAWGHHQPIQSGFDKFEESYHVVRDWLKSLEKLEQ